MTMAALTEVRVAIVILSQAYFNKMPILEIHHAAVASTPKGFFSSSKFESDFAEMVGIGGDDGGDTHLASLLHQPGRRIEAIVAFLVDAACVDFHHEAFLSDKVEGFEGEFAIPWLVFMEITVAVVHLDFVEVGYNVKLLVFNHFVRLLEETAHGTTDVAIEEFLQAFVIDLPLGAINEPDLFSYRRRRFDRLNDLHWIRSLSLSKGRLP